jgi:hypothetical protein
MSNVVRVDVESAVVAFRPAAGEPRSVPARAAASTALFRAAPWRTFRSYLGQRHYPGTYWAATTRDHVVYESRLELANLVLADFNPGVNNIVAQPFLLTATVDDQKRRHIPDYLWDSVSGVVVVDVVRSERMTDPHIATLSMWTKVVVESIGWSYLVVNEPEIIRMTNVRFLAGYRRDWLINQEVLSDLRCRRDDLVGLPIGNVGAVVGTHPGPLVRAALLSMLWGHEFDVDLDRRLSASTVLEPGL